MNQKLIAFVRAPKPGQVKTRLAKTVGGVTAAEIYQRLMDQLFKNLKPLRDVELRFTPDLAKDEFGRWLRPGWELAPQGPGDLGTRLARAFQECFAQGSQAVVVIGSDCPAVVPDDIESAWRSLATNDVVLGPARDGGYWLIGLRAPRPCLFETIPWSTSEVLETTLRRASDARLAVQLLRTLQDIDTVEDWWEFTKS